MTLYDGFVRLYRRPQLSCLAIQAIMNYESPREFLRTKIILAHHTVLTAEWYTDTWSEKLRRLFNVEKQSKFSTTQVLTKTCHLY